MAKLNIGQENSFALMKGCINKRRASRLKDSSFLFVTCNTLHLEYWVEFWTGQRQDKKDT